MGGASRPVPVRTWPHTPVIPTERPRVSQAGVGERAGDAELPQNTLIPPHRLHPRVYIQPRHADEHTQPLSCVFLRDRDSAGVDRKPASAAHFAPGSHPRRVPRTATRRLPPLEGTGVTATRGACGQPGRRPFPPQQTARPRGLPSGTDDGPPPAATRLHLSVRAGCSLGALG